MAIQFVGGRTQTSNTNSPATFAVSLTLLTGGIATFPSPGDLVLIAYSEGSTTDLALSGKVTTAGFSLVSELYANDTYDMNMAVFSKVMGSSPDYSVNVVGRAGTASSVVINVLVFRGVDQTTPFDVTATTATAIDTANANPAAITPVTADNVIAIFGANASTTSFRSFTTATTSYLSGFKQAASAGSTVGNNLGAGYVTGQPAGVSYDPSQWDVGTSPTTSSSGAVTIALRPSTSSNDSLTGSGVTTGNPVIDATSISQSHGLTSNTITAGSPSVPTINMAEDETFVGNDVTTGTVSVQSPSVNQDHTFTSNIIETGNPSVGSPTLTAFSDGVLLGVSITTGTPVVDESVFSQNNPLLSIDITTGYPSVPSITMAEDETFLGISVVTGIPSVASGIFTQAHSIDSSSIATGNPVIGSPSATQEYQLTAANINTAPPTIGEPTLTKVEVLSASSITTDSPSVGGSSLTQAHFLSSVSIAVGSPTVGTPVFALIYGLSGTSILSGTPVVSLAYINASKRRIISVEGNTANFVSVAEVFNSVYLDDNNAASLQNSENSVEISDFNGASYRNEHNRVA